jgi:death-on-curing protein
MLLWEMRILIVAGFIHQMENISFHMASGLIDKDFLLELIYLIINETEVSEDIKLKIFEAISNHES